jgi:hypothetical protein
MPDNSTRSRYSEKEEREWNPSQPLEDPDVEAEAQARAKQKARLNYLTEKEMNKLKEKKRGFLE